MPPDRYQRYSKPAPASITSTLNNQTAPHRVWFVGESPPPRSPPDFVPFDCDSGSRLAVILGLKGRAELLAHVPRRNVFDVPCGVGDAPKWDAARATVRVAELFQPRSNLRPVVYVALGERVAAAHGFDFDCHYLHHDHVNALAGVLVCPHPSGRSTTLNQPGAVRVMRRAVLPDLVGLLPRLPLAAFNLGDAEVLADLAHVVCPAQPTIAARTLSALCPGDDAVEAGLDAAWGGWPGAVATLAAYGSRGYDGRNLLDHVNGFLPKSLRLTQKARKGAPPTLADSVVRDSIYARACALRLAVLAETTRP